MPLESKSARFALNDIVYRAKWVTETSEVTYSARYLGVSGDHTIHLRISRYVAKREKPQPKTGYGAFVPTRAIIAGLAPRESWEIRLALGEAQPAVACWRVGADADAIDVRYYDVDDAGALVEVAPPKPGKYQVAGFRAPFEEADTDKA